MGNTIVTNTPAFHPDLGKPHFYSVKETCRILSLGRTTVFGLLKNQVLIRTRYGRKTLVSRQSVDNYAFVLMLRKEGGHASSAR